MPYSGEDRRARGQEVGVGEAEEIAEFKFQNPNLKATSKSPITNIAAITWGGLAARCRLRDWSLFIGSSFID